MKGPSHPFAERDAVLFVTRDGLLHLLFAQDQIDQDRNLYTELNSLLFQAESADELLTHASFTAEKGLRL